MSERAVKIRDVKNPSMSKAIRTYCLQCGGGQPSEVRDCHIMHCPLWPYRFGANPKSAIRNKLAPYYRVKIVK